MSKQTDPFTKATEQQKRLKMLLFGASGVGKTTLALQFPSSAVIDMEKGADLYGGDFDFYVKKTSSCNEVMDAINFLMEGKHEYKTLIIDPITIYWESLQKKYSDIYLKRKGGTKGHKHEFYDMQSKDWMPIKAEFKELMRKLVMLDMNIVCIAREKAQYREGAFMVKTGDTFDGEKGLEYWFDTVIRMTHNGGKRAAFHTKNRGNKLPYKDGESFECTYKVFQDAFGDILTKDVEAVTYKEPEEPKDLEWFQKQISDMCIHMVFMKKEEAPSKLHDIAGIKSTKDIKGLDHARTIYGKTKAAYERHKKIVAEKAAAQFGKQP